MLEYRKEKGKCQKENIVVLERQIKMGKCKIHLANKFIVIDRLI